MQPVNEHYGFLVLAAGSARRFGGHKLLADLQGKPMIGHTLDALVSIAGPTTPVIVCINPKDHALITYLQDRQQTFHPCPNAEQGMGHTLADAVSAHPHWPGWIICLGDMPYIQPSTYLQLLHASHRYVMMAPQYHGERGHPVCFHQNLRETLCQLRGDRGARSVLTQHAEQLELLTVNDPGITLDIDAPSDLNRPL